MRQVTTHLIENGHHNIGFINGPSTTNTSAEKLEAFQLVLTKHSLSFQAEQVLASDFDAQSGYVQTMNLLDNGA